MVNNPELAAALADKAARLKSSLDQAVDQDKNPSAPDIQAEPDSDLGSQVSSMPTAIELIVQGYVHLNDRQALESLKKHREGLATHLRGKGGWFDYSASIRQIEDELAVVEAGLARLNLTGET